MARIKYYYDGHDFDDYKVIVKASTGMIDMPEVKEKPSYEWSNMNGHIVDTAARQRYKERTIELQCSMYAESAAAFMTQTQNFMSIFRHTGLKLLRVTIPGISKDLYYLVYLKAGITITKRWSSHSMVGTFTIKIEEPEPMKCVILGKATCTITAKLQKRGDSISVYWGDGAETLDITATEDDQTKTSTHVYSAAKIAIVTGDVEYATITTTNPSSIIWNLL